MCNNIVLSSCILFLVCAGFQKLHRMYYSIHFHVFVCFLFFGVFIFICFPHIVLPCQNFLYILFPGLKLNGEWSGDFSGEASTPQRPFGHRSLAPRTVHFPVFRSGCLSSYSSLTCTCQNLHNWASIFHFIVPFLLLQALSTSLSSLLQHLDTGHALPATNFPSVSD